MGKFPLREQSSVVGDRRYVETNCKINSSTRDNKHANPS